MLTLVAGIATIFISFGLLLWIFLQDKTILNSETITSNNNNYSENTNHNVEKFTFEYQQSADYQQSPVTGQCKYQADTGLVCPMKFFKKFDGHDLLIDTYLNSPDKIKLQCCQYLLDEWGDENNVGTIVQQDDFIKHHWSNSDALYILTKKYHHSDSKFIGCVAIDRTKFYPYLSHLYIIPEYRKKGMGKFLLEFVEKYTSKSGFSEIRLWCNPSLFLYYNKLGYIEESREADLIFMTKKISRHSSTI